MINFKEKTKITNAEKCILDWINSNWKELPYMTVNDLCQNTNSTPPTVFRLLQKLNFQSYRSFQNYIIKTIIDSDKKLTEENIYISSIYSILSINSEKDIKKFTTTIKKYKNVYIYGMGYSHMVAKYFVQLLKRQKINASILPCCNTSVEEIKSLPKKSLAIFISYSGESGPVVKYAKTLPKYVKLISLTSNCKNSLASISKTNFYIPLNKNKKIGEHRFSFIIFSVLVSMLSSNINPK